MTRLLRTYLQPYRRQVWIVVVLLLVQAIGNLLLPSLNADIIDNGVVTGDTGYIVRTGGVMLAVTAGLALAAIAGAWYSALASMGFGRDVRSAIFRRVQGFSLREVNDFGAPSLITRNTNDVQQVQQVVLMGLAFMVSAPITAVGGVIMALRENVRLSGLIAVVIPVMLAFIAVILSRAIPLFRAVQTKIDRINQVMREQLTGVRVVRAFVRTRHEEARFAEANADLTDTTLRVTRLFALTMPAIMFVINVSSVLIVWFGGRLIDSGRMQIGDMTAFLSYMMQILFSVMMAVMMAVMVPRAAASAERIQAVLDTVPAVHDPERPVEPGPPRGVVELRDVEFGYPGAEEPVLRGVSVRIEPGRTTAVVGSTGSGKTTLVNLLPRLYDVTAGAVLLDGVDVRAMRQEDVWRRLGIVPQKAFLFNGTVATNLRFGRPDATDEELWHALEVAQAADFVRAMPDGLDSRVDQAGANFSGGQRQRLSIARALVRRPAVYVFDDSFSALDYATDARLRAALARETTQASVVIVAQRISTILDADSIVVLDGGRVVGTGTHDELLESCPTYAEIVSSQLAAAGAA
ncbi:ABC transporter ATP-binding protein [Kineosporia sp. A_224]|uniref:ABC transporter ATP-binding protein n=1 Tax=Kineosporia sp. A_224 TaxID=1962180 RepID=UPI000B4B0E5B|nr:ABC transporter ATP-binding protein [Kineosporia sp. A_224]